MSLIRTRTSCGMLHFEYGLFPVLNDKSFFIKLIKHVIESLAFREQVLESVQNWLRKFNAFDEEGKGNFFVLF